MQLRNILIINIVKLINHPFNIKTLKFINHPFDIDNLTIHLRLIILQATY